MTNLTWFNSEYEKILHSNLSDDEKDIEYRNLMTKMKLFYKFPVLKDEKWEKENKTVMALYRKIFMSWKKLR